MKRKILVICGHPNPESLSEAMTQEYIAGAQKQNTIVKELCIRDLSFNPILKTYKDKQEKDIKKSQKRIQWADHLVFIFPVWWGTMPALLKGWLDRTLTPGFAFKYIQGKPKKLLTGKTAELIKTSGGPRFIYRIPGASDNLIWSKGICGFTGIKLKRVTHFGGISPGTKKKTIQSIFQKVRSLGVRA